MAEGSAIGYGIGQGLHGIAEGLRQRYALQYQDRERRADDYEKQAREIATNIAKVGGKDAPEAKPYLDQLQQIVTKHNSLYAPHETPALIQRIQKFMGRGPKSWNSTNAPGLTEPGNITDLFNRPILMNPDGGWSTTSSKSFNFDGQEVLIPTVVNGQRLTDEQAIDFYRRTGQHLGKFKDPQSADTYATSLHNEQERRQRGQYQQLRGAPLISMEGEMATAPRRENTILQELSDLTSALVAGGQAKEVAGKNAIQALNKKYGINLSKPPRIERDPVTHNIISATDEESGAVYDATNIATAPQNVQQAFNAAKAGEQGRPADEETPKTAFQLFLKTNPNATVQDWADFQAKEAKQRKSRKEQITDDIATAYEKGDKQTVARLQGEMRAIDPEGAERLRLAEDNYGLRVAAGEARKQAALQKQLAPLESVVKTAETARQAKAMGDAGNPSADVDLTLAFFKTIRGEGQGAGIRFSQTEQNFITGARSLSESLEVRGNQVFSNGQPLATNQRQRMMDVIEMHAKAAQRTIEELQSRAPATPGDLKRQAKPKTPGSDKEDLLNEINATPPGQ